MAIVILENESVNQSQQLKPEQSTRERYLAKIIIVTDRFKLKLWPQDPGCFFQFEIPGMQTDQQVDFGNALLLTIYKRNYEIISNGILHCLLWPVVLVCDINNVLLPSAVW